MLHGYRIIGTLLVFIFFDLVLFDLRFLLNMAAMIILSLMLFHAVPERVRAHKVLKLKLLMRLFADANRRVDLLRPCFLLARSLVSGEVA